MLKKTYSCDICSEVKNIPEILGLYFSNLRDFRFTSPRNTEGKHICHECINKLGKIIKERELEIKG